MVIHDLEELQPQQQHAKKFELTDTERSVRNVMTITLMLEMAAMILAKLKQALLERTLLERHLFVRKSEVTAKLLETNFEMMVILTTHQIVIQIELEM